MRFSPSAKIRKFTIRAGIISLLVSIAFAAADMAAGFAREEKTAVVDIDYYQNVMAFDRVVALTFDDGPDPQKTREIVSVLNKHQVPATFFFLGSKVLKYPQVAEEVARMGHEIGAHSFTHSQDVHQSRERIRAELISTREIIASVTGKAPVLYRPPYLLDIGSDALPDPEGHPESLDWIQKEGFIPVGADIDSLDWKAENEKEIVENVINSLSNGHIILMHDGVEGKLTPKALDLLISELKKRDYRFVTVENIIGLHSIKHMMPERNLYFGMTDSDTGGDVTRLQTYLLKEGEYFQEPTGIFDEETLEALIAWQEKVGLIDKEVGFINSQSREVIQNSLETTFTYQAVENKTKLRSLSTYTAKIQALTVKTTAFIQENLSIITVTTIVLVVTRIILILILSIARILKNKKGYSYFRKGVSVIIPAYNEEENIEATIKSILRTRRKKIEIIVVNDGSTDNTGNLVLKLQREHPTFIKYLNQENAGKDAALNKGVNTAKYEILITVDGDTIFTKDTISLLTRPFKENKVAAVAGKVQVSRSSSLISRFQHLEYTISQNIDKNALSVINGVNVVPGPIGAWRKSALIRAGGFSSDTLVEDQDMTLALLKRGRKIVYQPHAVAYTETPHTLKDFVKQRARWILGTIQCLNKYSFAFLNPRFQGLGLFVLPHTLIYSVVLPLLYPLMDIMFFGWLFFGIFAHMGKLALLFILTDMAYGLSAFINEKDRIIALLWFPFQRIFYRAIIAYVVLLSSLRMLEGGRRAFKKVVKRGEAYNHFVSLQTATATN